MEDNSGPVKHKSLATVQLQTEILTVFNKDITTERKQLIMRITRWFEYKSFWPRSCGQFIQIKCLSGNVVKQISFKTSGLRPHGTSPKGPVCRRDICSLSPITVMHCTALPPCPHVSGQQKGSYSTWSADWQTDRRDDLQTSPQPFGRGW